MQDQEINSAARVVAKLVVQPVTPLKVKLGDLAPLGAKRMSQRKSAPRHRAKDTHPIILNVLRNNGVLITEVILGRVRESIPDFTKSGLGNQLNILRKGGFVSNPKRGLWAITDRGLAAAEAKVNTVPKHQAQFKARKPVVDDTQQLIANMLEAVGEVHTGLKALAGTLSKVAKRNARLDSLLESLRAGE